jgi:hypothetical protein
MKALPQAKRVFAHAESSAIRGLIQPARVNNGARARSRPAAIARGG